MRPASHCAEPASVVPDDPRIANPEQFDYRQRVTFGEDPIRTLGIAALILVAACGSKQSTPTPVSPVTLVGAAWQLEDLAGRGVIDNSHVTLQFMADGKVAGSGGCNRYSGSVAFKGLQIKFTPMASTMMACAPALMDQETRYFDALTKADTVSYDKTGALLIGVKGEAKPLLFRQGK